MGIFWLKDSLDQNRFLVRQILGKFFSSKKKGQEEIWDQKIIGWHRLFA